MTGDEPDQMRAEAVDQLKALGLSTYAARTFVALVSLGEATAKDVSHVSEVPRTRVYDAVEELQTHGLVDVQESTPRRFWAVSPETTSHHFTREYSARIESLTDALDTLAARPRTTEQGGVWTVTGREAITERIIEFVDGATSEVAFMTVEELLTDEITRSLRAASDRGVSIRLAGMSDATEARLDGGIPGTERFDSLWDWTDTPAGRLLMVDEEQTLVSVLVDGSGDRPPEPRDETAIWGAGPHNGLVVVLKALFTWQIDGTRD